MTDFYPQQFNQDRQTPFQLKPIALEEISDLNRQLEEVSNPWGDDASQQLPELELSHDRYCSDTTTISGSSSTNYFDVNENTIQNNSYQSKVYDSYEPHQTDLYNVSHFTEQPSIQPNYSEEYPSLNDSHDMILTPITINQGLSEIELSRINSLFEINDNESTNTKIKPITISYEKAKETISTNESTDHIDLLEAFFSSKTLTPSNSTNSTAQIIEPFNPNIMDPTQERKNSFHKPSLESLVSKESTIESDFEYIESSSHESMIQQVIGLQQKMHALICRIQITQMENQNLSDEIQILKKYENNLMNVTQNPRLE